MSFYIQHWRCGLWKKHSQNPGNIVGSVLDYHSKASFTIKWVINFWFLSAYKSYVYSVKFVTVSCQKKKKKNQQCTDLNFKILVKKNANISIQWVFILLLVESLKYCENCQNVILGNNMSKSYWESNSNRLTQFRVPQSFNLKKERERQWERSL